MSCRLLLAVCIVTCTCFRDVYTDTTSAIRLKDIICVLVLSGVQKEDLDNQTIVKLQEHNVNTNKIFNNEQVKQDCYMHHLQRAVNISHHVYLNNNTTTHTTTQQGNENSTTASYDTDSNTEGDVVLYKYFINNATNQELNLDDNSQGQKADAGTVNYKRVNKLTTKNNKTEVHPNKSYKIGFKLNDSHIPKFIKPSPSSITTKIYEITTNGNPIESTTDKIEEYILDYETVHNLDKPAEPSNIPPSLTKIDRNVDKLPLIANLDDYIKGQIAKYLSETGKTKTPIYEYPKYKTKNIMVDTTPTVRDSSIKEDNRPGNASNGPVIIDMNSISILTDNIKNLVLNHIRQELQSPPESAAPRQITETSTNIPNFETTVNKEDDKEKVTDINEHVEAIAKLMELIERVSTKTTATSQPIMLPAMSPDAQTHGNYPYKNEHSPYHDRNDHNIDNIEINPTYNGAKQMHTIPKTPSEIPELSYASQYQYPQQTQEQISPRETQTAPHQIQNLPITMPKSVSDTKIPSDTVNLPYDYANHPYEHNKQHPGAQTLYVYEHQKPQDYDQGKVYELPKPQVQEFSVPRTHLQRKPQTFIKLKPQANTFQAPQQQSYVLPFNQPTYALAKPQNTFPQAQLYNPPTQSLAPKQYANPAPQGYEYPNVQQHAQHETPQHEPGGPALQGKHYWLPPVVSYDKLDTRKQPPVLKIQTNIAEIPPLRFISSGHPVYQNIIVPKKSADEKPQWKPRESVPKTRASPKISADSTSEQWNRINNQIQLNIEDMEPHHESYAPRLDDIWHYNQNHYGNAAKYHVQLESQQPPAPAPHRPGPPAPAEPEHTRVASRQQMPYAHNHIFADTHIKKLMKSQQRISDILEHVLTLNKMLDESSSQFLNS